MAIKKDTKVKKTTTNTKRSNIKEITNGALIFNNTYNFIRCYWSTSWLVIILYILKTLMRVFFLFINKI